MSRNQNTAKTQVEVSPEARADLRAFIDAARAGETPAAQRETWDEAAQTRHYNGTWRAKQQKRTGAKNSRRQEWSAREYEVLRRDGLTVTEKALILRRSYESVRNKMYRKDRWPEDERP